MKKQLQLTICLLSAIGAFAGAQSVHAQTVINSLPYTINSGGEYVLGANLFYNSATGAAITFNSGNAVLDFRNHFISGANAGLASQAIGLQANEKAQITIRNGTISGFFKGIAIGGNGSATTNNVGHIVENMRLPSNRYIGIEILNALNTLVQNCQVSKTGGTTVFGPTTSVYGIYSNFGSPIIKNNQVTTTTGVGTGPSYSIYCLNTSKTFVVGNTMDTSDNGLRMQGGFGKYQNNLTAAVTTPFQGGIDAGGNN